jgi:GNAT superfamily N-acetyltransferase
MIRELGRPGDLGWVVKAHGEQYAIEYGWDASFESLVARIVADYDPSRSRAWIAEVDGRRAGCVFCIDGDDGTAVLRLLLVDPAARGHGIGAALVDTCLAYARGAGYARMRLWTNDPLVAARGLYLRRGFMLTREEPHHSFGADLVGQTYELSL